MAAALVVEEFPFVSGYSEALLAQRAGVERVLARLDDAQSRVRGELLLGEHTPVYTLGRHGDEHNMHLSAEALERLGIELVRTNRGGDITYHGPGQLVGYPILHLPSFGLGARAYIACLEAVIIATLQHFGIEGMVDPDAAGVWLAPAGQRGLRKICAIGVHIGQGVSMHGFALNVSTDLAYFSRINPCGFTDRGVTSLSQELGSVVGVGAVADVFRDRFEEYFGCQLVVGREAK